MTSDTKLSRRNLLVAGAVTSVLGGLTWSIVGRPRATPVVVAHWGSAFTPALSLGRGEAALEGQLLRLTLWGGADAGVAERFGTLTVDVMMGEQREALFHAWQLPRHQGASDQLAPVSFVSSMRKGLGPEVVVSGRAPTGAPWTERLKLGLSDADGGVPLRTGVYVLAVAPEARRVSARAIAPLLPAPGASGPVAAPSARATRGTGLEGMVLLTLRVEPLVTAAAALPDAATPVAHTQAG